MQMKQFSSICDEEGDEEDVEDDDVAAEDELIFCCEYMGVYVAMRVL